MACAGPQAPARDPDQRTRRRAVARGAATSNPAPPTKKVKKTSAKTNKAEGGVPPIPPVSASSATPSWFWSIDEKVG